MAPPSEPSLRGQWAGLWLPSRELQGLRETLCRAQSLVGNREHDVAEIPLDLERLDRLIHEIDLHRPLDRSGKHDRHTATCGCADLE